MRNISAWKPWDVIESNFRFLSSEKRPNLKSVELVNHFCKMNWFTRMNRAYQCSMSIMYTVNGNYIKLQLASYFFLPLCRGAGSRRCHAGRYMYHEEHRRSTLKTYRRKQFTWIHFTGKRILFSLSRRLLV